ncbi:Hypothetical_protein [Hexamita inflata]|uniref:Hypothetical_protein n=1 Tax=Hexamita inflata TaxID=28002 RepID=A0AA86QKW4_9EUKA|nr:Hypothetical protein HINF_LOCUS43297 [Hexamita inflata]
MQVVKVVYWDTNSKLLDRSNSESLSDNSLSMSEQLHLSAKLNQNYVSVDSISYVDIASQIISDLVEASYFCVRDCSKMLFINCICINLCSMCYNCNIGFLSNINPYQTVSFSDSLSSALQIYSIQLYVYKYSPISTLFHLPLVRACS